MGLKMNNGRNEKDNVNFIEACKILGKSERTYQDILKKV